MNSQQKAVLAIMIGVAIFELHGISWLKDVLYTAFTGKWDLQPVKEGKRPVPPKWPGTLPGGLE